MKSVTTPLRLLPPKSALKVVGLLSRPSIPMDNRKRRLGADDNASSVSSTAPRPPLKKRFTGTGPTNFSSPSSPVKAESMQLIIDTNVLDVRLIAHCSLWLLSSLASFSHVSLLFNSLRKNPSLPYCEV
jgi:hypothetical protein